MNAESGSGSSGTFIWGVIAGIAVLVGAGGLYLSGRIGGGSEEPASQQEVAAQSTEEIVTDTPAAPEEQVSDEQVSDEQVSDEPAAAEPEATETAGDQNEAPLAQAPVDEQDTAADAAPQVAAPALDQIFVEPDGNTVLSGNAEPGSNVRVLLDGEQVHSFTVDPSGQFAEFLSIPFSENARGLSLEAEGGDQTVQSDDYVIAALPAPEPTEEPVLPVETVDEATTTPEEEPEPETEVAATAETDGPAEIELADAGQQTAEDQPEPLEGEAPEATDDARPDQQIAILRSGDDGVELVQPPAVQSTAPEQIALDTIGYSHTGDVELTGRVSDGSAVRLYLDNRLVDDLAPADDGKWRSELEGIDPGVYTLRVDEVGADGTVVSRLETPFKREPVEVLEAAEAAEAAETAGEEPPASPIRSVTVQKGDTLWAISRERFGDGILYVRLFEANRDSIRDPDLIYPGQIVTIPE